MSLFIFDHTRSELLPTTVTHRSPLRLRRAQAPQSSCSAWHRAQHTESDSFHQLIKTVPGVIYATGECHTGATPATQQPVTKFFFGGLKKSPGFSLTLDVFTFYCIYFFEIMFLTYLFKFIAFYTYIL